MYSSKPRGSRIIYVAASARELPEEVQQWLGRAEHRAARSPHIYDALALLAGGARPAVMIVSMQAVDWSEMAFFDLVARISRHTHIFVAGHSHDDSKLKAACKRGARLFEEESVAEALSSTANWSRPAGVADILAARLPATPPPPVSAPLFKPVRPESFEGDATEESSAEESIHTGKATAGALDTLEPASEPEPADAPPVRLVDALDIAAHYEDLSHDEDPDLEPHASSPGTAEPRPDDLEAPDAPAPEQPSETSYSESTEPEQPIPFPWAPAPNRPQRIPPRQRMAEGDAPASASSVSSVDPAPPSAPVPVPPRPAELTAEELAALMGKPIVPEKPTRESRA
ncbi:MAG TPA: hypothetical protein PKG54_06610 [Phycisphaerae bacterium]|jgi:hypothetical protein|nr:hypothetical protein [Phycisphaerae bacterium]HOB74179.1 hypothetical protein [Phycisphaerae bacterium]HOJ55897.1 hypothetical protein [Phycisphaerae bacterium]HOL27637.1 hypothetical protein [Phycisphaerae bacterium]HPP22161.1 hypothetical protein [Phycisphaerae bacterium]